MSGGGRRVAVSTIWACTARVLYGEGASREVTEKGKSLARMRPLSRLGPFGVRAGRAKNNLALTVAPGSVVLAGAKLFRAIFMRLVGFYCMDGRSPGWLGERAKHVSPELAGRRHTAKRRRSQTIVYLDSKTDLTRSLRFKLPGYDPGHHRTSLLTHEAYGIVD